MSEHYAIIGQDGGIVAVNITQSIAAEMLKQRVGRIVPSTEELYYEFSATARIEYTNKHNVSLLSITTPKGITLGYVLTGHDNRPTAMFTVLGNPLPPRGDWAAMVDYVFDASQEGAAYDV